MASKGSKRLIDDDGKEYVFSCEKFNNVIKKYQRNRILVISSHDARDVEDLGGCKWKLELR